MSEPNTSNEIPRSQRIALAAAMFLITGSFGFLQPFTPLYLEAAGLNKQNIGILSALGTGAALLIQPILGRLSDRFDVRRPFMTLAAICAALAYLSFRQADGFLIFTLLTALGVNGYQYLNAVGGVLIGRMVQAGGRGGAAYVQYRVWGSVGYVLIGFTTGLLVKAGLPTGAALTRSHLDPVFTYGPLLFFVVAVLAFLVPDARKRVNLSPPAPLPGTLWVGAREGGVDAGEMRDPATSLPASTVSPPSLAPTQRVPGRGAGGERSSADNLNRFCFAYFLYQFALYGASGFLPFYIRDLGGSPMTVTAMFAAGVICEVLVMSRVGRWTDIYGRRPALAFSFLLMPLRLLLYIPAAFLPSGGAYWVLAVQTLHGINFGIIGTIAVVFVNDLATDGDRGAMQARLAASAGLGLALGPLTCGFLSERYGIPVMFALMSLLGIVAAVVFLAGVHESHGAAIPHRHRLIRWLATPRIERSK